MADELTPGQVRARRFDLARKGYDRTQVDAFLSEVAARLDALESAMHEVRGADPMLGIEDPEALAREMHRIGGEVADILEAARAAAEGIRSRASHDAKTLRDAVERESSEQRQAATDQSQALRASAWKEGSAMLASASSEAQAIIAQAKEETLFMRAEAEREALRLTSDARREREEAIRVARVEADQTLDLARQESDGMLAAAAQQAEMAQERARALEARRAELLGELEAARAAIGELESEIESRRQELETPEEPTPEIDERTHHTEDGGSVRIVSPTRVVPLKPVDAEELVAEVTALRSGLTSVPELEPEAPALVAPEVDPPASPAIPDVEVLHQAASPVEGDATVERDETGELDTEDVAHVETEPASPHEPPEDADREELAEVTDTSETGPTPRAGDLIGSLFARLREAPADAEGPVPDGSSTPSSPLPTEQPSNRSGRDGSVVEAPTPEPPPAVAITDEDVGSGEPDPSTIRAQNDALRVIKRSLVDLQNETLEHLRTDASWVPSEEFTDRFGEPFSTLTEAIGGDDGEPAGRAFGLDLRDAVIAAIERARTAGGGDREVAAAASKVFRTWRSDEAERRVVDTARSHASV